VSNDARPAPEPHGIAAAAAAGPSNDVSSHHPDTPAVPFGTRKRFTVCSLASDFTVCE